MGSPRCAAFGNRGEIEFGWTPTISGITARHLASLALLVVASDFFAARWARSMS